MCEFTPFPHAVASSTSSSARPRRQARSLLYPPLYSRLVYSQSETNRERPAAGGSLYNSSTRAPKVGLLARLSIPHPHFSLSQKRLASIPKTQMVLIRAPQCGGVMARVCHPLFHFKHASRPSHEERRLSSQRPKAGRHRYPIPPISKPRAAHTTPPCPPLFPPPCQIFYFA